ncbi:OmpA family protein [Streptomyces sp. NPDC001401]|uniref:OmpA family protein n=1 Tax=Streptomyces sp. NPDC001401 TaxID=3364570 RepID=UPI0036B03E36
MTAPLARRASRPTLAVTAAAFIALTCIPQTARATPFLASGLHTGTSALIRAGGDDPDLALPEGATLAEPKVLDLDSPVLDISQITEDAGGHERREDTNPDEKLTVQADVLFSKDSAHLSGKAKARITAMAQEIKMQNATRVRICGFTDSLGSSAHGALLSKQRAAAVRDVLGGELNDTAITFDTRGYGEKHPIASNATEAGRTKNRRVEVSFPHAPR